MICLIALSQLYFNCYKSNSDLSNYESILIRFEFEISLQLNVSAKIEKILFTRI